MKTTLPLSRASLLGLFLLLAAGCGPQPGSEKPISAEPTSFREVTSQLDPGGNLYLYVSTQQWLEGLSGKVAQWRQFADNLPGMQEGERENLTKALDLVTNLIKDSGLEEVSGFGMSSIAIQKGMYHSKAVLHHYPGKGSGFAWKLFGQKPHPLDTLDLLPTNTVFASFSDFDAPFFWSVVQKEVTQSGLPQAQSFLEHLPDQFEKATKLKWSEFLASLGGEFGVVLTLDSNHMLTLPVPGQTGGLEVPEPALMLVAKVTNDTIFNRLDTLLKSMGQQVISEDKPGLKLRTVPVPLPLPIQLRPTIAASGGYLLVATTDALVHEALAVKAGQKPGLRSTEEFKRLTQDVPTQGNQVSFLSQRFGQSLKALQQKALGNTPGLSAGQREFFASMLSGNSGFAYTVGACTDQGCLSVGNGNQNPGKLLFICAAVPAVLSAIAIPNFIKARETAQKNACINNLRQIDGAKQQWALENKKPDTAVPTRADLEPFLPNHHFPTCPAGGRYTINPVSEAPQCSHPGHTLPQ